MNKKIMAFIFILALSIPLVESYKVFPNPIPSTPQQIQTASTSGLQSTTLPQSTGTVYATSNENNFMSLSDSGDKIEIRKSISPNSIDYCIPNRVYCLCTELKGTKWTTNNILIKDYVESPMQIIDLSEPPHIIDPFKENSTLNNNINYNIINNTIYIKIKTLEPNYRINYAYKIRSNEPGVYESNIIARIGNHSTVTDLDYSKEIKIAYPQFDVNVDIDRLEIYSDCCILHDPLHITYNLLYKSTNSRDPILCNISFDDSESNEYDIYIDGKEYTGELLKKELSPENYTPIDMYVRYSGIGPHRIPEILLDGRPYIFDYEITVSNFLLYWADKGYPITSIVVLILLQMIAFKDLSNIKKQIKDISTIDRDKSYFKKIRNLNSKRSIFGRKK